MVVFSALFGAEGPCALVLRHKTGAHGAHQTAGSQGHSSGADISLGPEWGATAEANSENLSS